MFLTVKLHFVLPPPSYSLTESGHMKNPNEPTLVFFLRQDHPKSHPSPTEPITGRYTAPLTHLSLSAICEEGPGEVGSGLLTASHPLPEVERMLRRLHIGHRGVRECELPSTTSSSSKLPFLHPPLLLLFSSLFPRSGSGSIRCLVASEH